MLIINPYQTPQIDPAVPATFGKDEMNLAELPFTMVTEKLPRALASEAFITRETRIFCPARKRYVDGTLTIQGSQKYGYPTASDARIQLALLQLSKEQNNFTSPEVFSHRFRCSTVRLGG